MTKREDPKPDPSPSALHAMRRGEARHEVTERVVLRLGDGRSFEGWALNLSRGGIRLIVEEKGLVVDDEVEVTVGDEASSLARRCRVVWLREEPDGLVVGVEFLRLSGSVKAAAPVDD